MSAHLRVCLRHAQALLLTTVCFLGPVATLAQEQQQTKRDDVEVIKVTSNLVSLDVLVKDKKGKAITDLKAQDFTVTENGVRQKIEFFDSTLVGSSDSNKPTIPDPVSGRTTSDHLPRNIISLVLDGQTTEGANLKHVRDGVAKYIRERISDTDSVALFAISGSLQLLQPFTQDKAKLLAAADQAYGTATGSKTLERQNLNETIAAIRNQVATDAAVPVDTAAGGPAAAQAMVTRRVLEQYVQLRSALSAQQTRPILASLAAICEGLRSIPGKKTLVMFSQGFVAPEALDWQVQSTIDIANRANVAIYIIDSSGLTGGVPQSGALVPASALSAISAATSQESRIRAGAGESVFDITRHEGLDRQQDLLYRISGDTGGQFIKNTNDISLGLNRVDDEVRSRYTIAYRSTDSNFDGNFRKVKIEVARAGATVAARSGYHAIPPDQTLPFSPVERKLLADFAATSAHPTLPLALELTPFRSQPGLYTVPLSFEIPSDAVRFERQGDKQRLQLDVLGVVRMENEERILSRLGGFFDVSLNAEQYKAVLDDKIFYRQDMQLEAGAYVVDFVVKDRVSGKAVAKKQKLVLPVAGAEFSSSEIILSRHVETAKQPYLASAEVISDGNVLIRPSPSKEFRTSDNLVVFFKLYNEAPDPETGKPLVTVTVLLRKDGKLAMKPLDYRLSDLVVEPLPHMNFAKYIKLAGLAPGNYSIAIESTDVVQKKLVKQAAQFVITP
jgi:VWFA-related protein